MNITTIKALFLGWAIGPACTILASIVNSYASMYLVSLLPHPVFLSLYFILSNYIIHASFAFLSGYTAAKIAKKNAYYYATFIALTGIILQLIINWQIQQRTHFQPPLPFDHYFSLFATLPFACSGAYVAMLSLNKSHLQSNN
jgi:hypothetical protein